VARHRSNWDQAVAGTGFAAEIADGLDDLRR